MLNDAIYISALQDEEFLAPVLEDEVLCNLLNLYYDICNAAGRPFRYPPTDACQKLKDVLNLLDFFDHEDMEEVDELRDILTHYHIKALLQVDNELTNFDSKGVKRNVI